MTTTPTETTTTPPSTPILYGPLNVEYLNGKINFLFVCFFLTVRLIRYSRYLYSEIIILIELY